MKKKFWNGMENRRADNGVSEIIGTMLLLGITVTLFSLVYVSVLAISPTPLTPSANIVFRVEGDDIIIDHCGGAALSLDTKILMMIGNRSVNVTAKDGLDDKYKDDDIWGMGEKLVFPVENLSGKQITINVVDVNSNSLVMTGKLRRELP
jgi:FlaG/FlaF family flagellin (archaellin)